MHHLAQHSVLHSLRQIAKANILGPTTSPPSTICKSATPNKKHYHAGHAWARLLVYPCRTTLESDCFRANYSRFTCAALPIGRRLPAAGSGAARARRRRSAACWTGCCWRPASAARCRAQPSHRSSGICAGCAKAENGQLGVFLTHLSHAQHCPMKINTMSGALIVTGAGTRSRSLLPWPPKPHLSVPRGR